MEQYKNTMESQENPSDHQTSKDKVKTCAKDNKEETKSYKNRIFVGGISIDLTECYFLMKLDH